MFAIGEETQDPVVDFASYTIMDQFGKKAFMPNLIEGLTEVHYKNIRLFSIMHVVGDICNELE